MNLKTLQGLIFKELNAYYKDYKEDIEPRADAYYIDEFTKNERFVKIIFDQVNFRILNVSKNVEAISGHTVESLCNKDITSLFKYITLEHITYLYVWLKWTNQLCKQYGMPQDSITTFCGVKIKSPDGQRTGRMMIRHTGLEYLDNGAMKISLISLYDMTHLMKSDFYWGRIEFGNEKRLIHHLVSTDKKDIPQDLISDREKDVLCLIAKGMESKEIGKELFISSHTVDNHRRNMIAKTGARDTTALVQICLMAGII
jgi:DNA-binding CsgD family transcriptional regulator